MRNRFGWVAILMALTAGLCAAVDMTTLTVRVRTLGDHPIDNASVIVKFVKGRAKLKLGKKIITEWEIRTNQDGIAKVPPVPQGSILVQVIAKGYQTFGQTFSIDEEQKTVEVKLNPPQAQFSSHQ